MDLPERPEKEAVFELLDRYARGAHRCLLTEMFLNDGGTEYILCFRPLSARVDSSDRYACRYVHLEVSGAKIAAEKKALPASVIEHLNKELVGLH